MTISSHVTVLLQSGVVVGGHAGGVVDLAGSVVAGDVGGNAVGEVEVFGT